MHACERCGIDQPHAGLCIDCADVTGEASGFGQKPQRLYRNSHRGAAVTSTLSTGQRLTDWQRAEIIRRRSRGEPVHSVALAVGVSSRAVTRVTSRSAA